MQSIVSPMDVATSNTDGIPAGAIHHWLLTGHLLQAWGPPPRQPQLVFCLLQLAGLEFLNLERGTRRAEEKTSPSTNQRSKLVPGSMFQRTPRLAHTRPVPHSGLACFNIITKIGCLIGLNAPPLLSKISSRQCPLRCPNLSLPLNKLRTM